VSTGAGDYAAPVPAPVVVVRGFDPVTSPFGAGHRGVDLALAQGTVVRAASVGMISFAGRVAGRPLVVIAHPDGIRTEYEPVLPLVAAGEHVAAGDVIGRLVGLHPGCVRSCLHWGARRGDAYLDPLTLLRPLGPVRLLPWP
jgi:murein DD-endopeptidase MepM/ murein hydrolase activator NlpD